MVCGGQEERDGAWQDARLQSNDLPAKWMEDDAEDLFPDFLRIGATVSIRFHRRSLVVRKNGGDAAEKWLCQRCRNNA